MQKFTLESLKHTEELSLSLFKFFATTWLKYSHCFSTGNAELILKNNIDLGIVHLNGELMDYTTRV